MRRAVLHYRHQLDTEALHALCRHGRPGVPRPPASKPTNPSSLTPTLGPLEETFLEWCERWKIPLPHFNMTVHGVIVDAYWPAAKLVVELDGHDNHSSPCIVPT